MRIHFLIHESFEAPGAYLDWALENGHQVSKTEVYHHEKVPTDSGIADMLIVMGGPQSPKTTLEECDYFDAQAEMVLIKAFADKNKPVVGVCLGAQLMGEAYGADVERSPQKEIGSFDIHLTDAGRENPHLSGFPETATVGHWHGDMPGLSENAKILAYSEGCPRQIVQYGPYQYGFQCHLEFSKDLVEGLIESEDNLDEAAAASDYIHTAQEIRDTDYDEMNVLLKDFLNKLTAHVTGKV